MMEQTFDEAPRTYIITRSQHLGYGFVAGDQWPTMVKSVQSNGPSYDRLQPGDVIMAVNGIDVEDATRDQIIRMIQLSGDQLKITVRKLSYGELIRAKNLTDPKFYQLNKSHNNAISSASNQYSQASHQPAPLSADNQWQFNRLVTSISQQQLKNQQQHPVSASPNSASIYPDKDSPPVRITHDDAQSNKQILKQKQTHQPERNGHDECKTVKGQNVNDTGKNIVSYGRFSPIPQRCKSSMDVAQGNQKNKKSNKDDDDQPTLKRRNTMRPIRPPPEVREILQSVIKIFFEDGHSKTLKYNKTTTVGDILETLNETPDIEQVKGYFGLALTVEADPNPKQRDKAPKRKLLHILDESDSIMKIGQLPYSHRLRLLYRMVYPPSDVYSLYKQSKLAFEYLYQQSRNDLKLGVFSPELDEDTALKLSALHLLEYVHSNHSKAHGNSKDPKVYIKLIKRTRGIEYFVPVSMADSVLDKDGRRVDSQYKKLKAKLIKHMKKNFEEYNFESPKVKSTTDINRFSSTSFHELILPEMQSSPSDYIKLLFLNYLSQLACYGNARKPARTSTSPMEQASSGDCSSSIESVPRISDSLPLIKQDRSQNGHTNNLSNNIAAISGNCHPNTTITYRPDNLNKNNLVELSQTSSVRSLSSARSPSQSQSVDQLAATPSIESISSITFNIQNSPSPPDAAPYIVPSGETYGKSSLTSRSTATEGLGPSPMPRHQTFVSRKQTTDSNSIDKLYSQRYQSGDRYIDDLLRNIIILPPPPPPSSLMFDDLTYQLACGKMVNYHSANSIHLTQVLTDKDIEKLRVPPPPRIKS